MKTTRLAAHVLVAFVMAAGLARVQAQGDPKPVSPVDQDPRVVMAMDVARTWLEAQRAYDQIPGVSAAVVYDQQLLWSGGFGYADVARRAPADQATIYSICSISKLFTSIAVMQLRDGGKLRLDDPLGRHLPWFRIKQPAEKAGDITIEGLLTHASGLPRESDYPYWTDPYSFPTREQIIERLEGQETLYPPETYYQYSNLGLTLAGEVVAAASDQTYADYVERNILQPLRLSSTAPRMPEQERGKRLAVGYSALTRSGTRTPLPFFTAGGITPAAGFSSTADDLARFESWQFRLLAAGAAGSEVLKAPTLREMHRIHFVDPGFETMYGLGFSVWRSDNKTFVGHGGSCPGYRTHVLLRPEEKIGTVFLSNALGVNPQQFAQRLYDIVAPAILEAVKDPGKGKAPDPELRKYVGSYNSSLAGEIAVVLWKDSLAMLSLPTTDPVRALSPLKKTGEHTFSRVRKGDETLGESIVFEMGKDGRPTRFTWNSNYYPRLPDAR